MVSLHCQALPRCRWRGFLLFLSFPLQPQAVGNYADTAECHGSACYHGIQQETVDRVEHAGCDGYTYYVIDKCPKQILTNGAYGQLGEFQRFRYFGQVGRYDSHFGYIHCDVASSAHGDAEVGLCQGCAVVDAVAHHCHFLAVLLQVADKGCFSCGKTPAL